MRATRGWASAGRPTAAALALLLAGTDRRVDAVAADITWNDLAGALFPGGVFKKLWAGLLFQGAFPAGSTGACGRLAPEVCAAYQRAAAAGRPDAGILALLRASSPSTVLGRITAPTLLTQGEQDSLFPLGQADANARGIAATGTPVAVRWRSGGHDTGTGTDEAAGAARDWFTSVLKERRVPATAFRLDERGSALSATNGRGISQTISVAGGYEDAFAPHPVAVGGPTRPVQAPAGGAPAAVTAVPGLGGVLDAASAAGSANPLGSLRTVPEQTASFVSAPLPERVLQAGSGTVRLSVRTRTTSDATLFVGLVDVAPDGSSTLPSGLVTPVRLTDLTPGTARTVEVTLPSVVRELAAGHRLAVTVSTTDLGYALPADARSYDIGLSAPTVVLQTVDGTVLRAGHPFAWLVVGLAVALLVALLVAVALRRRRRAAGRPDPTLADVPIAVLDVVKEYADGYRAVDGVSFRVERGQVVGLLGPNGAGKTTTLRMLVGLIAPTSGKSYLFGEPVVPGAPVLARIGAFIEGPGFLPHLSGRDNLRLYWAASGRPQQDADVETALQIAGLGTSIDRRVSTYSHGMKQRLGIAQAMLGLPDVLVLDEPTNGLDPPQIAEMREVLQSYARSGRTVVVSSHLLAEVEQTCTHVVVMHKGRLIAAGSVREVAGAGGMQLAVRDAEHAAAVLARAGVPAELVPARRALEDVFLAMVGDDS